MEGQRHLIQVREKEKKLATELTSKKKQIRLHKEESFEASDYSLTEEKIHQSPLESLGKTKQKKKKGEEPHIVSFELGHDETRILLLFIYLFLLGFFKNKQAYCINTQSKS